MTRISIIIVISTATALACAVSDAGPREPVVGGLCQGCELVFDGRPARIGSAARIAPPGATGEPLQITGTRDGAPVAGTIVYAYHTNAKGKYPGAGPRRRHGTWRGWAKTDRRGRYRFDTIRPASYPIANAPPQPYTCTSSSRAAAPTPSPT
jgi:protocatechuate 3,4-dioxygenase beta subunit